MDQLPGSFFGPVNLVDLLRHRALHQPRDRAFVFLRDGEKDEELVTYGDIDRRARAMAAMLQKKGLEGERALLLYPSGIDFIVAFFGCMYAGMTAVTAYPPRRNRNMNRIEAIANDAQAKIALTTQESLERVQGFITDTPKLMQIEWQATDQIAPEMADAWYDPDVHGETLALLQYTSGSTGTPKGVMLSHANLLHNSAMIAYAFEHTRSGSGVFWLPSYHDMGLVGGILQPMYCGCPNIIFSPASFLQRPLRWLKAISRYRATISGGPNFAYDLAVEKITDEEAATLDLSNWSLAFNGAEPIRSETLDRFVNKFGPCGFRREAFYPCYGLAEATLIVSGGLKAAAPVVGTFAADALENHEVVEVLRDEEGARELVGSGGNLLDQKIVIADPETRTTCPDNRVGEIWVSGPSVAQGYWNREEDSSEVFAAYLSDSGEGPFLRTGDLGFMVGGEVFVTGRLKDLIIVRGVNYYPQDIEQTVDRSHERLRTNSGAAFTVGPEGQERLIIVQEAARQKSLNTDEICEAIRRAVAAEHDLQVDTVVLIKAGSVPKTSSGKIQRHACRNGFMDNSLSEVGRWSATEGIKADVLARRRSQPVTAALLRVNENVLQSVYQAVRKTAMQRAGDLQPDTNIVELGLDSLERMEIAASLEEEYGGRLPEEALIEIETCAQVAAAIEKYIGTEPRKRAERPKDAKIEPSQFDPAEFPEVKQLDEVMNTIDAVGLANPYFREHEGKMRDTTLIDGRELINWSSFNYIGMSGDPRITESAKEATDKYGTSASASRLVSGNRSVHGQLEKAITEFVGVEDALVFSSGHGTNESTIGHLMGPADLILHDELAHNSIIQGSILSGARRRGFAHNDWRACEALLKEHRHDYRRVLIAIEGVYSMDGDFPDLPKFIEIKKKHQALLMVDEAHSVGVMGLHGRGMAEHFDLDPREIDLAMGTLSKALGSVGGYIAGCKPLIRYLRYTAPAFVFATGIAPASAAAAMAAIRLLEEEPERVAQLAANSELFLNLANERGMNTGQSCGTPVVPVILGNSQHCLMASEKMLQRGINVQPILHPAVEESASRLRFFITSTHTESQIRSTVDTLVDVLHEIDPAHLRPKSKSNNSNNGRKDTGSNSSSIKAK